MGRSWLGGSWRNEVRFPASIAVFQRSASLGERKVRTSRSDTSWSQFALRKPPLPRRRERDGEGRLLDGGTVKGGQRRLEMTRYAA